MQLGGSNETVENKCVCIWCWIIAIVSDAKSKAIRDGSKCPICLWVVSINERVSNMDILTENLTICLQGDPNAQRSRQKTIRPINCMGAGREIFTWT